MLLTFPFENSFISFSNPTNAFYYYNTGTIQKIVEGDDSAFIYYQIDNSTYSYTFVLKEGQRWKIPDNLYHIDMKDLFIEMLDDFSNLTGRQTPELILEKVATMSCKAAVKGNHKLSLPEVDALMTELLTLENPFCCPHGRPTIISMSKYEIEKKFKRIVS